MKSGENQKLLNSYKVKMKLLIVFLTFFVLALADPRETKFDVAPGEINAENFGQLSQYFTNNSRIASGTAGKKGENLYYCYVSVNFIQKSQVCGCTLVNAQFVVTSGRCCIE